MKRTLITYIEWLKKSVKINNAISYLLILTVILGMCSTMIEWPKYKVTLINGATGFRCHWHIWVIINYVNGFLILSTRFISRISSIDKDVMLTYLCFDVYSLWVYLYSGWPERKDLIIFGFCMGCILFIFMREIRIWKQQR